MKHVLCGGRWDARRAEVRANAGEVTGSIMKGLGESCPKSEEDNGKPLKGFGRKGTELVVPLLADQLLALKGSGIQRCSKEGAGMPQGLGVTSDFSPSHPIIQSINKDHQFYL